MKIAEPYHEGELFVQQKVGETAAAERNGGVIADSIMPGALRFIEQQPMAVVGSLDAAGNAWASLLFGKPSFMKAVDERTAEFDLTQTVSNRHDPFWKNIEINSEIGMLVIELATRRRLRLNGEIRMSGSDYLRLEVKQSYPNCPKYIQRRHAAVLRQINTDRHLIEPRTGNGLQTGHLDWVRRADTFFVASSHPERGVDASHRGGNPGFVQILDEQKLRVPDYIGNSMFNTLGNFVVNPRAGLVFLDFEANRTLQLIGRAEIQWRLDDTEERSGGTHRFWDFTVERWMELDLPKAIDWEFLDYSPFNPD